METEKQPFGTASVNKQNYIVGEINAGRQPDQQTLANYDAQIA